MHAGIDLSTTTARCVLLDGALNVIAVGRQRHTGLADNLRQRAGRWIGSVERAVAESAAAAGVALDRIGSIGIATQGVASVMVDEAGNELSDAQGWLSAGDEPTPELATATIESWYSRSGRRISPATLAGRLLCNTEASTGRWALAGDLIAHQLTGQWVVDPCLAATTALLDQCSRDWSGALLGEVGVEPTSLSRIGASGTVAGNARGPLAARLGLSPDAIVATPTQDQRAAVLVADPDETSVTVTFGTAVAIVRRADGCASRLSASVPLTPGLQPDTWWHEGVVPAVGVTFDWCAELMGLPNTGAWLDLAGDVEVGSAGVVCEPWFGGRGSAGWDLSATGALRSLQLGTSRSDVARAVVDGVCAEIVTNVELLGPSSDVRVVGRASAHPALVRTVATLLGRPVTRVIADEPTAYGAALLGAQAGGHIASAHAHSRAVLRSHVVEPGGRGG
ncbi:MAG: FGGY-family carbohydrate kinase [Ilumatobacteraceae bacterium]